MLKNVFVFGLVVFCGCAKPNVKDPSTTPDCTTVYVFSEDCIIASNSCNNPVKSKEDFDRRCETEENMMFHGPGWPH